MAGMERLTLTLPSRAVAYVKRAVAAGDYRSVGDAISAALEDLKAKCDSPLETLAELKADIAEGLADLAEGRVRAFDPDRIEERGRTLLAGRSTYG